MSRKRYRPEEGIARLREANVLLGQGVKIGAGPTSPADYTVKKPSLGPFQHWYPRQES